MVDPSQGVHLRNYAMQQIWGKRGLLWEGERIEDLKRETDNWTWRQTESHESRELGQKRVKREMEQREHFKQPRWLEVLLSIAHS